ncbi:HSP20 family protein [Gillisia mitskevichiae]|uniref:HSP20 family protein n=1 Tax=Gillisia mitskevichiae TaxID=270921 RepID=A0A495PM65_9FLAO|nr:Hsp20/alpha crystallin family protein [Gillisia mitskevichiae]RKS50542.1 HSP20 family protein [Gillisia mitskevichiae]
MSLIKSNHRRRIPMLSQSLMPQDPFFSEMMNPRRSLFNLNRLMNADFDDEFDLFPSLNVKNLENEFEVELAAPGLSKDDFKVTIDNGILNISAEIEDKQEEKNDAYMRKEFSYHSFSRSLTLPETVDENKDVKAQYKDGVLKLKLRKVDGAKSKPAKTIKIV